MQDGLYAVSFQTPMGAGAGVIVKSGNSVSGGDSAYAWYGEMNDEDMALAGSLQIVKHGDSMISVFGPLNNFTLSFTGSFSGGTAKLTATTPAAPTMSMMIALRPLHI